MISRSEWSRSWSMRATTRPARTKKLDGNQLPSEGPKVRNPRNLVEHDGIRMLIVPVLPTGEDGGLAGPFWCFVINGAPDPETPPRRQEWTLLPVDNPEGVLMQFNTFEEAVEAGYGEGELRLRGKV